MLDLKLVANGMAVSIMHEMINNEDKKGENETEKDVARKSEEKIKQDCEINASKRLLKELRKRYPKMPFRIIADSLYPSETSKDKESGKDSVWMWITNRKITEKNVQKLIRCAKTRDYIENQGFREQKRTTGIEMEHVYSKNVNAIRVIYTIIQLTHMILQIIEHSDICGEFKRKYGSVKVFCRNFYAHLTQQYINIKIINIKIQIRFDKSLLIY